MTRTKTGYNVFWLLIRTVSKIILHFTPASIFTFDSLTKKFLGDSEKAHKSQFLAEICAKQENTPTKPHKGWSQMCCTPDKIRGTFLRDNEVFLT